jgi:2-aminoethylphosphonate-pyruvate transaminase
VVGSTVPRGGKLLVIINGAYGRRIAQMAEVLGIESHRLEYDEDRTPDPIEVEALLEAEPGITNVFVVHCETTTGILNPIEALGQVVKIGGRIYCVDAMSSFGAIPVDFEACGIDYLVSSANKCIEGVPGFSFVLARRGALVATKGYARSLSLDLLAQWKGLESNGQFRFTPPTHALLAFYRALLELEAEGGVTGRAKRYRANHRLLRDGMEALGFSVFLDPAVQSYIITSFYYPEHPAFDFNRFYSALSGRGFVIYPGKLSQATCFRMGNIGQLFAEDIEEVLAAVTEVLEEMEVTMNASEVPHEE